MRVTEKWREEIEKGVMPAQVQKTYIPEVSATEAEGVRKAAFVVSTGSEDRDGDTVNPDGWMLDNYRKNPVVLWAHDVKSLPIARAESIGVQGGKLKSVTVFPEKGTYPFADQVYGLLKGGFLKGTSVGFHPVEATPRKGVKKGVDFRKQELYEFSLLPIPSNREALVEAKAAGYDVALVVKWASEFLDYAEANGLWVPKFQIEKALAQVRNLTVTVPAMPPPEAGVGPEGHAIAGAVLSDDEMKGLYALIEGEDLVLKYIKREGDKWCVYSKDGKKLGSHDSRAEAVAQLQAIEASKHAEVPEFVMKHGDHDQSTHGRGGGDGGKGEDDMDRFNRENREGKERAVHFDNAARALKKDGGFSLDRAGNAPKGGYMVSPYKEREKVIDGDADRAAISAFAADNEDLLSKPGHFLGGWKDGGKTYLDVSVNVESRDEAHALGAKHGQLEVYNVAEGKSEKTEKPKAEKSEAQKDLEWRQANQPSAATGWKVPKRPKKEIDMDAMVTKLADELFGEDGDGSVSKAAPPWTKEGVPAEVDPKEAAKAAKEAAEAQNAAAEAAAEGETPKEEAAEEAAEAGAVPGGDPTEADPQLAGILDDLARGLLAEIEPLKQGGEPTNVATALKTALEKFAASFMQTYVVPGSQATMPGAPPAPAAKPPAAPGAKPPAAPPAPAAKPAAPVPAPPGQAPQAAPAAPMPPPAKPGAPPYPPKKGQKGISIEGVALDEDALRATIQKVLRQQMDEARMHLTGRLPG